MIPSDSSVVTAAVLKAPAEEFSAFVGGEARELRLFSFVCVVSFIPELCRGDRVLDWRKKKYTKRGKNFVDAASNVRRLPCPWGLCRCAAIARQLDAEWYIRTEFMSRHGRSKIDGTPGFELRERKNCPIT